MNEEGISQGIQTASKIAGGMSFTSAATAPWWMTAVPWGDIAIIVSAVGGVFFMIERYFSMRMKRLAYKRMIEEEQSPQ